MSAVTTFARDVLDFPLHPRQAEIIDEIYDDGISTAVLRLGRRSGKGRLSAICATYESTSNADAHLAFAPPGEKIAVVVIATSMRQARVVHGYVRGSLSRPAFAGMVVRETADEIELSNGITIIILPAHAASVRGYAIPVLILDEAAWYTGLDGGPLDVGELWKALIPSTAQFPHRRIVVMSTPRWGTGWFPSLCERAAGRQDPQLRTWHASTHEMNPAIPQSFLDAERAADPVAYEREYEARFVSGLGAALDAALVRAAATRDEMLPPVPGMQYVIAADPAFTGDRFAVIVGHREQSGRVIVDRVTAWAGSKAAPVSIDTTLDAIRDLAAEYNRARCLIDQFAAEPIRQELARRGVRVEEKPWTNASKVDALAAVRRCLYAGRLELPRHRELIAELCGLEQRPLPSGAPRIAAPGGQHDDFAMAALALIADLGADSPPAAGGYVLPAGYARPSARLDPTGPTGPVPPMSGFRPRRLTDSIFGPRSRGPGHQLTPAERMDRARRAAEQDVADVNG
jgi:hypothetical protein